MFGDKAQVPESCCVQQEPGCGSSLDSGGYSLGLHQKGCVSALQDMMSNNIEIMLASIAGAFAIQVDI